MPPQEAPAYEEVQQQPHVSTNIESQNRHFSYAQTPVEHEAFIYMSSPNDPPIPQIPRTVQPIHSPHTPIDSRPQSVFNPLTSAAQPQPPRGYLPPSSYEEKHPVSPISPHDGMRPMPFSPVSPMPPPQHFTQPPQPPPITIPQTSHARNMSSLSPINTNIGKYPMPPIPPTPPSGNPASPLPSKTPITPISPESTAKDVNRENRNSYAIEPYSPHGFGSTQTNNFHAVFSPDAAHGPNGLDFALHQPGQIAHPNMNSANNTKWRTSLCSCGPDMATCFTGLFCPCVLYGRTAYRLSQKSAKKDPTDMLGHSSPNGHCMVMALACGFWGIFPALQRARVRRAYKLDGSLGSDLLKGCCCCCCVTVQNEREVRGREGESRRWAGPASGGADVYARTGGMVYKPQQ
ncbi:PLAC8 family-domain-containing protein [Ampelomyces quisqualis]|uniref:PLAC8 family-domain-containing protein n=1 Tax=Ampelomyces quisqualis TaxID=50730 RepID=A0A6A5R298_AMPQU|nr:PLAC8 family-domain-containing protein [Ampelomyces quisqualis]